MQEASMCIYIHTKRSMDWLYKIFEDMRPLICLFIYKSKSSFLVWLFNLIWSIWLTTYISLFLIIQAHKRQFEAITCLPNLCLSFFTLFYLRSLIIVWSNISMVMRRFSFWFVFYFIKKYDVSKSNLNLEGWIGQNSQIIKPAPTVFLFHFF